MVTAILVVSCPCAIGLAFPLTDEMATVALRRFGVFVREADVWPRLSRIRKIIFDKTGTLTLETPELVNPEALANLSPVARAALAALVRDNAHPVSQCLHENLLANGLQGRANPPGELSTLAPASDQPGVVGSMRSAPTNTDAAHRDDGRLSPTREKPCLEPVGVITEEPGFGVTLRSENGLWSLGRPGWRSEGRANRPDEPSDSNTSRSEESTYTHDTEFACDGVVLARFQLRDAVRADAVAEIAALHASGFQTYILSGDRREKVAKMAALLGIPAAQAMAEATPQMKADSLGLLDKRDTLMLGDGANDSLAFDAAFVRGTPVIHRGVLEGKADFYYLGHGLSGIRRLFEVNETRRRTQTWLLVFSIAYNALAVGLAATGHMNPLIAAILMPVSSLLTLATVVGGMRRWLKG